MNAKHFAYVLTEDAPALAKRDPSLLVAQYSGLTRRFVPLSHFRPISAKNKLPDVVQVFQPIAKNNPMQKNMIPELHTQDDCEAFAPDYDAHLSTLQESAMLDFIATHGRNAFETVN